MKEVVIVKLIQTVYGLIRPILYEAIDDPNQEWDDTLMELVDGLMNYQS